MTDSEKNLIQKIDPAERVSCCPSCRYRDGFHVSLLRPDPGSFHHVILICPSCHARFDLGWKVDIEAP